MSTTRSLITVNRRPRGEEEELTEILFLVTPAFPSGVLYSLRAVLERFMSVAYRYVICIIDNGCKDKTCLYH
jgi:hypothetical protein